MLPGGVDQALPGEELLILGRYAEAWPLHDERSPRLKVAARCPWPEWQGESLAGKSVLIWGEQGIGDEVMFARFLPQLRARGAAYVTVLCRPENRRLFLLAGADRVEDRTAPQIRHPAPDVWAMLGSLPRRLGVTYYSVPGDPYLRATPRGQGGVGVAWRGSPLNPRDVFRSLPSGDALLSLPGARELVAEGDTVDSLETLAGLDLVVTVDTAWAHLAGALGKPVWILLPNHGLDWRWGRDRATTPWYPTARLFRQPPGQGWGPVLDDVAAALRQP